MDYEPGCERLYFPESWRERHGLTWNNFLNNWGFAIGPFLLLAAGICLAHGLK
jgi:hypothetical protein